MKKVNPEDYDNYWREPSSFEEFRGDFTIIIIINLFILLLLLFIIIFIINLLLLLY